MPIVVRHRSSSFVVVGGFCCFLLSTDYTAIAMDSPVQEFVIDSQTIEKRYFSDSILSLSTRYRKDLNEIPSRSAALFLLLLVHSSALIR